MDREDPRPWYFLHIPKTAGTSFRVLLENSFHLRQICPAYEFHAISRYSDEQLQQFRLFRGHMGYSLVNYLPVKPRTMVMLRDPMERAVSHFEYISRDPAHPRHRIIHERKLGLKDYLLDPELSAEVTNAQVRPLAHVADRGTLKELLAGSDDQAGFARVWRRRIKDVLPPDDELLDVALRRLEAVDFVGTAETLDKGMEVAAWLLGAPTGQSLPSLNVNPGRTRLADLPADVLELLEQATVLDRRLYARGRELFARQYRKMRDGEEAGAPVAACPVVPEAQADRLVLDFRQPLCGRGWHQRELVPGKGILRWSGPGRFSDIHVALPERRDYLIQVVLADWLNDEFLSELKLTVDDKPIPSRLLQQQEETRLEADLNASFLGPAGHGLRLGLMLPYTGVSGQGGEERINHCHARKVGVAVYRFEIIPV